LKRRLALLLMLSLLTVLIGTAALAQRGRFGGRRFQREEGDRNGVPVWENETPFQQDVFTFVRVRYTSGGGGWGWEKWRVDYPDSDLNFSFRLHELTSLEVDPNGKVLDLTDEALLDIRSST